MEKWEGGKLEKELEDEYELGDELEDNWWA